MAVMMYVWRDARSEATSLLFEVDCRCRLNRKAGSVAERAGYKNILESLVATILPPPATLECTSSKNFGIEISDEDGKECTGKDKEVDKSSAMEGRAAMVLRWQISRPNLVGMGPQPTAFPHTAAL
jgi:hypothetical protein